MALLTGECPFLAQDDAESLFAAMIRLLGTVTGENWPDHATLPGWGKLAPRNQAGLEPTLAAWLAGKPEARPLGPDHLASDVVLALLRWCPAERATMDALAAMPFVRGCQPVRRSKEPEVVGPCAQGQPQGQHQPEATGSQPGLDSRNSQEASGSVDSGQCATSQMSDLCECTGNCGDKLCSMQLNKRRSQKDVRLCERPRGAVGRFCARCKCESACCQRPRNKTTMAKRWCLQCHRLAIASDYANSGGFHQYDSSLTGTLKVVARVSWVWQRILPLDTVVIAEQWREWCPQRRAGSPLHPDVLVAAFFAHALKTPGAVKSFARALPVPGRGVDLTGRQVIRAVREALAWADGKPLKKMHAGMSFGLMRAVSGIVVVAEQLGLLQKDTSCKGGQRMLSLGTRGSEYVLVTEHESKPAIAYADAVLEATRAASPRLREWPASDGLADFGSGLAAWAKEMRLLRCNNVGLVGGGRKRKQGASDSQGASYEEAYHVKHFTRSFLLVATEEYDWAASPGGLGSATVREAHAKWLPDRSSSMQPIAHWSLEQVARKFCMNPVLVSMASCFAQQLKQTKQDQVLAASDAELLAVVSEWEEWREAHPDEDDCWPPSLETISQRCQRSAGTKPAVEKVT